MFENTFTHRLQTFAISVLFVITVLLLVVLASVAWSRYISSPAASGSSSESNLLIIDDSSNAVTRVFDDIASRTASITDTASAATMSGISHVGKAGGAVATGIQTAAVASVRAVGSSLLFTAKLIGTCIVFPFRMVGSAVMLVVRVPVAIVGYFSRAPVVSSIIMPADQMSAPTIEGKTPQVLADQVPTSAPAAAQVISAPVSEAPQWPIHGVITTLFGVPEPPFMPIHTGLDISDGKPAGVTPIHPFRPGRVIEVIHSHVRLGNEVVVDHGNGVISIYGHMHATMVTTGEQVTENTVLGFEGSTGVSTGPHLHFEIRVDGVPRDPHKFISGQP